MRSNDLAVLEIFRVEEVSNLLSQENFWGKTQEPNFPKTCDFHRKEDDHQNFNMKRNKSVHQAMV